jgi:hypothetical protein
MNIKKRKPRKATHRRTNALLEHFETFCQDWDDGYPECFLPWSNDGETGCNGNPFICTKLYLKYIASVDKPSERIVDEFKQREENSQKIKE